MLPLLAALTKLHSSSPSPWALHTLPQLWPLPNSEFISRAIVLLRIAKHDGIQRSSQERHDWRSQPESLWPQTPQPRHRQRCTRQQSPCWGFNLAVVPRLSGVSLHLAKSPVPTEVEVLCPSVSAPGVPPRPPMECVLRVDLWEATIECQGKDCVGIWRDRRGLRAR